MSRKLDLALRWLRRKTSTGTIFGLVLLSFLIVELHFLRQVSSHHDKLLDDPSHRTGKTWMGNGDNNLKIFQKTAQSQKSRRQAASNSAAQKKKKGGHEYEKLDHPTSQKTSSSINTHKIPSINGVASYAEDPLCGGCRSLKMESLFRGIHKERCGILIYQTAKESNLTILDAAHKVVYDMKYSDCLPCINCEEDRKHYWRYDHAAPKILAAQTYYFRSIPEEHRIPETALRSNNLTNYFSSLNQQGLDPKQYLFEYNPSIVKLPDTVKLDGLSERPAYLASFRIATTQGCFPIDTTLQLIGGEWISDRIPEKKDYLGLALLRKDLSFIEEVIVDLPRRFRKREDFRLFLLYDQIFLGSYCKMTPLFISHKSDSKRTDSINDQESRPLVEAQNVFPSPLKVKIAIDYTQCAKEPSDNKHSKNLNYFINSRNQSIAEMFPLNPHIVRQVHITDSSKPTPGREDDIKDEEAFPQPSFYNLDEVILADKFDFFEQPFTDDRGGACCIRISDPRSNKPANSRFLWLGISHVKTPHARRKLQGKVQSNQYLSRWYAFESEDPYKTVAVSGYFCFSSHHPGIYHSATANINPLTPHAASKANLTLGSYEFDCPVIHFVTGMTEKMDDPSKLIVTYGVADCVSWFAEVDKAEIVHLLFSAPGDRYTKKRNGLHPSSLLDEYISRVLYPEYSTSIH